MSCKYYSIHNTDSQTIVLLKSYIPDGIPVLPLEGVEDQLQRTHPVLIVVPWETSPFQLSFPRPFQKVSGVNIKLH